MLCDTVKCQCISSDPWCVCSCSEVSRDVKDALWIQDDRTFIAVSLFGATDMSAVRVCVSMPPSAAPMFMSLSTISWIKSCAHSIAIKKSFLASSSASLSRVAFTLDFLWQVVSFDEIFNG